MNASKKMNVEFDSPKFRVQLTQTRLQVKINNNQFYVLKVHFIAPWFTCTKERKQYMEDCNSNTTDSTFDASAGFLKVVVKFSVHRYLVIPVNQG